MLGEKAETWVARCFEISSKIVKAGLVDGVAVYGHWTGDVARGSHFAMRGASLPFVNHGWILLEDGRVLDPTRWVFENVAPYLYVGEPPDPWGVSRCVNCALIAEEHRVDGPQDRCDEYTQEKWPYDEGGNKWREMTMRNRPPPEPKGPRKKTGLKGFTAVWVASLLGERSAEALTQNQLFYLANTSYVIMKQAVGPEGIKAVYDAICDFGQNTIAYIPCDNANQARRECGFTRS